MSIPPAASSHPRPIALTMGDPCGIGPELLAMLFRDAEQAAGCLVVGDVAVMRRAIRWTGSALPVAVIDDPAEVAQVPPHCLPVLTPPGLPSDLLQAPVGQVDARAGQAAAAAIRHAARLALDGAVAAVVTAPIHKEALAAAGEPHPGHTELLQELAGGPPVRMMLASEALKTVLVTIHVGLRRALDLITFDNVLDTIRISHRSLVAMGYAAPRIAVAGLNPHAGEGGRFGDEEQAVIGPAVAAARAEGIAVEGPLPPDTVFMRARHADDHPGEFDVVVAMYHDQGLIPVKYLGLDEGVNVTLGLPFVRTSPDHGTAFDLAGRGLARPASLQAALRMARVLAAGALDGVAPPPTRSVTASRDAGC